MPSVNAIKKPAKRMRLAGPKKELFCSAFAVATGCCFFCAPLPSKGVVSVAAIFTNSNRKNE